MKKRIVVLVLIAVLVVFAAACTQKETPPAQDPQPQTPPQEARYDDGEYEAELDPDERGWKAVVELTVEGGKITEVAFDEVNEEGVRKSENEEYLERWSTAANIDASKVYTQYQDELIDKQNIIEVEAITGATSTHQKFQDVVKKALDKQ